MKNRLLKCIYLLLILSLLPLYAQAAPTVIRIADGRITNRALWTAFGGGDRDTDYHYRKSDASTGWKRVNGDNLNDNWAENIVSGPEFTVEKSDWWLKEDWKAYGTFVFQTYYNIAVSQQSFPQGGSVTITGGQKNGSVYEVNENENITFTFAPVSGYVPQIRIDGTQWQTVTGGTYTHKATYSLPIALRYTQAANTHTVTVTVNDSYLGTYSGINTDQLADGSQFVLTVTPYNEKTTPEKDRDIYVKSVTVNGVDMSGSYSNTVFTSAKQTVTGDMDIRIEFAPRLVYNEPTHLIQKYPNDPYTKEYTAKQNLDKAVSQQIPAIEKSILDSIINQTETAAFDPSTAVIKLQGVINFFGEHTYLLRLDQDLSDVNDSYLVSALSYLVNLFGSSNWGDISFNEAWEAVEITLPAVDKYPEVVTDLLTVAIVEARTKLNIGGTAQITVVESQSNIDAAVKAAVQARLLEANPGVTAAQLNQSNISYSYSVQYNALSASTPTNVSVSVSLPKGNHFLESSGTVTVPVKKSDIPASVTIVDDGNGTGSFTHSGSTYHLVLTPNAGYYVHSLTVTTKPENASAFTSEPVAYTSMSAVNDNAFSYSWDLETQPNNAYTVSITFCRYTLTATAIDGVLPYYEGLYATPDSVQTAVLSELNLTRAATPAADFPTGEMKIEYLARAAGENIQALWLPLNTSLAGSNQEDSPLYGCHAFGEQAVETLRAVYTVSADGFTIVSNSVDLTLSDVRIETSVRLHSLAPIAYTQYAAMTSQQRKDMILEGVFAADGNLINGAVVSYEPDLDTLNAGKDIEISVSFAGDAQYKPSRAVTKLTIDPIKASIGVKVEKSVVPYGTNYTISAETTPAGLDSVIFAAGLDISRLNLTAPTAEDLITSLHLISPAGLRQPLANYLNEIDTDGAITLADLNTALTNLKSHPDLSVHAGISAPQAAALEEFLAFFSGIGSDMPLYLTEEKPRDIGIYLVGGIISEANYEQAVGLAPLAITPIHRKVTLGWKNDVSLVTPLELLEPGLLAPQVLSVDEGTVQEAEQQLLQLFIGLDADNQLILTTNQSDLVPGAYTQLALTADWGNIRYSCAPLIRPIVVGQKQVNVIFKDTKGQPITELTHILGTAPGASLHVTYADGTSVPQGKLDQYLTLSYNAFDGSTLIPVEEITAPGLYIVTATYMETDYFSNLVAGGAAALLVTVTEQVHDFDIHDKTVYYDGQPHFIIIDDKNDPKLSYLALILDPAHKRVNLLLPKEMDSYKEILDLGQQFMPMIETLREMSLPDTLEIFLENLLRQTQSDLYAITDYWVEIGGSYPVEPGVYPVYVGVYGMLPPADDQQESISSVMLKKATLTILPAPTPVPTPTPNIPATGDHTPIVPLLLALSISGLFLFIKMKKRRI